MNKNILNISFFIISLKLNLKFKDIFDKNDLYWRLNRKWIYIGNLNLKM